MLYAKPNSVLVCVLCQKLTHACQCTHTLSQVDGDFSGVRKWMAFQEFCDWLVQDSLLICHKYQDVDIFSDAGVPKN